MRLRGNFPARRGARNIWRGVVVAVVGCVAALIPVSTAFAADRTEAPAAPKASHVIVVGVAGLEWENVSARTTPTLARLARHGSVGAMSAHAVPSVTCPAEGWLTLGAGAFSAFRTPRDVDPDAGCDSRKPPPVQRVHKTDERRVADFDRIRALNHSLRYDAHVGLLGGAVRCATAIGAPAALAAADPNGHVDRYFERLPDDPSAALRACPLTVVDGGEIPNERVDRNAALQRLDAQLAAIHQHRPENSVIIVTGISQTQSKQPRLQVAVANGAGFSSGWLRSPSTRRTPYVQLVDIAPTVMDLVGVTSKDPVAGRPWRGNEAGRPKNFTDAKAELVDAQRHALAQQDAQVWFLIGFGVLCGAMAVATAGLLYRRRRGGPPRDLWLRLVAGIGAGLAAVPVATSLGNLVPWWRGSRPLLMASLVVLAIAVAIVGVTWLARRFVKPERRAAFTVMVISGFTVAVFVVDAVTGCWLQLNSLLGYNPLLAGRFAGFGNPGFAIFGAAAVLFAGFLSYGHRRWVSLVLLLAVAIPVVAVEGFPQWGADVGGILTFVPAFIVLGLLVTKTAVTWSKLVLAGGAAVALVTLVGWLDYLRPDDAQTHFGRFFAKTLDGSAWSAIRRKLLANAEVLLLGPHTVVALLLAILLVVAIFRPTPVLAVAYEAFPALRAVLVTTAVLGIMGFATNDSGVIIPSVVMVVSGPLALALCAWAALGKPATGEAVPAGPASGGDDSVDGLLVDSADASVEPASADDKPSEPDAADKSPKSVNGV